MPTKVQSGNGGNEGDKKKKSQKGEILSGKEKSRGRVLGESFVRRHRSLKGGSGREKEAIKRSGSGVAGAGVSRGQQKPARKKITKGG